MAIGHEQLDDILGRAIYAEIVERVEACVKDRVNVAKKELERKIPDIVSAVSLSVTKRMTIERPLDNQLVITIADRRQDDKGS